MLRWGVIAGLFVTLVLITNGVDVLELPVRDRALRLLPRRAAGASIVVAIDEASLRAIGPWPWDRRVLADLVNRAADGGAHGVVIDVLLAEPRPGDELLRDAARRIPTVAVSVLAEKQQWLLPAPDIASAARIAHGNFELDHDGILRRFASTKQNSQTALPALPIAAASIIRARPIPVGVSIAPAFRTRPADVSLVSAADFFRLDPARVRGKLLFIGPTALGLGDRVLTPVSMSLRPDPGVTVHAAATESMIRGETVRELPPIAGGIAAGFLVWGTTTRRHRLAAALSILATNAAGLALLAQTGIAIPFVTLTMTIVLSAALAEGVRMTAQLRTSRSAETKLEEIATRLAEQRAQEVESKRVLAHELKTPLASMRNLTQLLAGFDLTESERRRVANLLESEAGKLEMMVTALLDLERLPLREFRSSSSVVDLGDLVTKRIDFIRLSTDRSLTTAVEDGIAVRADPALIERVIDNLVGNALKYTSDAITVNVRREGADASLEVVDNGPGIADAERRRIFDRFVRGSTAAGTEGLGLGLSLVAEVAAWHGGRVSVQQDLSGGSIFRFVLPLESAAQAGVM